MLEEEFGLLIRNGFSITQAMRCKIYCRRKEIFIGIKCMLIIYVLLENIVPKNLLDLNYQFKLQ